MKTETQWMALRRWVGLLLLVLPGPAYGVVNISPIPDLDLGTWSPALGDAQGSSSFCVQSANRGRARNYRVMVPDGSFQLTNTVDPSQTIPVRFYHEDLIRSTSQQLSPSTWSDRNKRGVDSCTPLQLNSGLRVEIDATDLAVVSAGTYQGTFTMLAQRNGFDQALETFNVQIAVGEMAWIQRLEPIALGYTMGSDASANEPFCIWTTTGAYDITISSQTPTGTTSFLAAGQAIPANTVDFGVQFDTDVDASDGTAVIEGSTITNQFPAASGDPPNCLADNAAIYVSFPEVGNLDGAPADTYADELTIVVEPR